MNAAYTSLFKVIAAAALFLAVASALGWVLTFIAEWLGIKPESTSLIHMFALIGLLCIPWFLTWRHHNHQNKLLRNNQCLGCEYDLTGNVSGSCPECGRQVPGVLILICEECGAHVALPPETRGTRQICPICNQPGNVPGYGRVGSN